MEVSGGGCQCCKWAAYADGTGGLARLIRGQDGTSPLLCNRGVTAVHMQWSSRQPLSMEMRPLHAAALSTPHELVKLHHRYLRLVGENEKLVQRLGVGGEQRGGACMRACPLDSSDAADDLTRYSSDVAS